MGRDTAKYLLMILCLMLVQILICNRIMLFSVAVPIIFFYPILRLPMSLSVKWVLTIAFLMGFVVDIFSDTPGVNTISCTVLAVVRRPVFHSYTGNDEALAGVSPCIGVLGFWTLFKYLIVCTPIYCVLTIGHGGQFISIIHTVAGYRCPHGQQEQDFPLITGNLAHPAYHFGYTLNG